MRLNQISDINFEARLIGSPKIKKKWLFGYKPYEVSLIEFNRFEKADAEVLYTLVKNWRDKIKYLMVATEPCQRILGLTTQKDNFEKINPEKMLGIMEYYDENKSIMLARLQTNPSTKYNGDSLVRKYKEVGSILVDELFSVKKGRPISLIAAIDAIPFYLKKGFILEKNSRMMHD